MTVQGLRELLQGDALTNQEVEVLFGAAKGETAKQTGERIFLAPDTIKQYRKQATAKLNAKNITHAVVLAVGLGIINIERIMPQ